MPVTWSFTSLLPNFLLNRPKIFVVIMFIVSAIYWIKSAPIAKIKQKQFTFDIFQSTGFLFVVFKIFFFAKPRKWDKHNNNKINQIGRAVWSFGFQNFSGIFLKIFFICPFCRTHPKPHTEGRKLFCLRSWVYSFRHTFTLPSFRLCSAQSIIHEEITILVMFIRKDTSLFSV